MLITGFIAAACGQLEAILQKPGLKKASERGMSNGTLTLKAHRCVSVNKPANGSLNGICTNGNGLHL